jgi:hypothetical protein
MMDDTPSMTRQEVKEKYESYRRAAKHIVRGSQMRVDDVATVWVTEGGAYVEASIWIPEALLADLLSKMGVRRG